MRAFFSLISRSLTVIELSFFAFVVFNMSYLLVASSSRLCSVSFSEATAAYCVSFCKKASLVLLLSQMIYPQVPNKATTRPIERKVRQSDLVDCGAPGGGVSAEGKFSNAMVDD